MIGHLFRTIRRALSGHALDLVCPHYCLVCRNRETGGQVMALCRSCQAEIQSLAYCFCRRCGARSRLWSLPCGDCQKSTFSFGQVRVLGSYEGRLRQAVLATKRFGNAPLCQALAQLLAAHFPLAAATSLYELIVPAPMHWRRRLERGFQGTAVMAELLARQSGIPSASRLLVQRRATRKQGTLRDQDRRANVRGAFRVRHAARLSGKKILLLDDVMTSGATAEEQSRLLLASGAGSVDLLVVARSTPGQQPPRPRGP